MALADPQVRALVHTEIHASPYREHKLHFGSFLRGNGSLLLGAVAAVRQGSESGVLAGLDSVIDLEFYLPIPGHFEAWDGGTNLIVASVTDDDGTIPVGFDLQGRRVPFPSADWVPSVPTLALVPVETDFSTVPLPAPSIVPDAVAQSTIAGVYMTYQNISNSHEGPLMGGPEFEVHVFKMDANAILQDVICSGESTVSPYRYNGDLTWSGEVLLVTEATHSGAPGTPNVQFQVWEDDDSNPCTLSGGRPPKTDGNTPAQLAAWNSTVINLTNANGLNFITSVAAAIPVAYNLIVGSLKDDIVGVMIGPANGCWEASGPVTFDIESPDVDHHSAGFAKLDYRFGQRSPICPLDASIVGPNPLYVLFGQPTTSPEYNAPVTGGQGTISYSWYDNGLFKGTSSVYTMSPVTVGGHLLRVDVTRGAESVTRLMNVSVEEAQCPFPPCP